MYTKKILLDKLKENKNFIDNVTLESFLKNWKIDPIYEDDRGEEYYDDQAVEKIIKGIELKANGETDRRIAYELNKNSKKIEKPALKIKNSLQKEDFLNNGELKKFTLDITNQTVTFLADAIAQKISSGITDHLKESDFIKKATETGSLQRDNEIMAKQIEKLIQENKRLKSENEKLKAEISKYKPLFRNVYIKT